MNGAPATNGEAFTERYLAALRAYVLGGGEAALNRAYELGRQAVAEGLGLLDLANIHHRAMGAQILGLASVEEASAMAWKTAAFFAECLAPFEIIQRGYLEANAHLHKLNATLESQVETRTRELLAERKAAEEEQARHLKEAQEGLKARDTFLSVASHELRTPVTTMNVAVQHLLRLARSWPSSPVSDAGTVKVLEAIERQGRRLARLFGNLLEVSNLTADRMQLQREKVDMSTIVRDVITAMRAELQQAGCTVSIEAPAPVWGNWDRARLEQATANLLSNAAKYGAGKPIEVTVVEAGQRVLLSIRDHGIGIAAGDQARIFEPFERAVSVRHYGGFGLGLWIVRQVVNAMGGEIRVQSSPQAGSTFTVDLPRAAPETTGREPE